MKQVPELPEVETTVRELKKAILGRKIEDVWSDFQKIVKKPDSFQEFSKRIKGRMIKKIWRRAKNIIIELSDNNSLLIHQKMTGHLLVGKWQNKKGKWVVLQKGPLEDPANRFLHLILRLDNGNMLALSDLRKFAKVELQNNKVLQKELGYLGPEPLDKSFTFEKFKEVLQKRKGKIKQVLMDQTVISGIGNIYSDEILWRAKIHPQKNVSMLSPDELLRIYRAIKTILPLAIKLQGESFSDYRRPSGEKGYYDTKRKVYRRKGEKCSRCGTIIQRIKIAGRSAHFCPNCQKL
ncbi:MAG: DNA-formamidopyrimidine glycosylase [bacterium]|nr:DNA-formamidopyrimidine glycosylase [bacterium]